MKSKIESEQLAAEPTPAPTEVHGDAAEQPDNTTNRQCCTAVKPDGNRCHANAVVGSQWCFFHDPASADDRIEASRRGGKKNRPATLPPDTPDFTLATAQDASALIGRSINQLLRGEIDPKIANAVGYLVTVKIRAMDAATLQRRVAALEAALHNNHSDTENGGSL
jgi:hypothetical protein